MYNFFPRGPETCIKAKISSENCFFTLIFFYTYHIQTCMPNVKRIRQYLHLVEREQQRSKDVAE